MKGTPFNAIVWKLPKTLFGALLQDCPEQTREGRVAFRYCPTLTKATPLNALGFKAETISMGGMPPLRGQKNEF